MRFYCLQHDATMRILWIFLLLTNLSFGFLLESPGPLIAKKFSTMSILRALEPEFGSSASFDRLKSIDNRLAKIDQSSADILCSFYDENLASFSVQPGVKRFSVTSTCFAIRTILASRDQFSSRICFDLRDATRFTMDLSEDGIPLRSIINALLHADWRDEDLFQVPLVLETVLMINNDFTQCQQQVIEKATAYKINRLVGSLLGARPMRRSGRTQALSDYLQFRCAQALLKLSNAFYIAPNELLENQRSICVAGMGILSINDLPSNLMKDISFALARHIEISYDELCRQLAYRYAGVASFDVIRLAYSLLTYVTVSKGMAGTAGYADEKGESQSGSIKPPDQKLIAAALDVFFAEQRSDGLWDKGQPIYKTFRKSGRNVGNAFVFIVDTVSALLENLPSSMFRNHIDKLEKLLHWIEDHQKVEVIVEACDAMDGKCYGKSIKGWASPHLSPDAGPDAWSTAQTLLCIQLMRKTISQLMHTDVLREFKGLPLADKGPRMAAWIRLLDTDLGDPSQCITLKDVINSRVLSPFAESAKSQDACSISYPGPGAAYSAILFGPPGTAKTTICEAVAEYMGWDFLVIDTSAFLADGLSNVASRIRYVFERLQSLEKCVILFDEIEEFCLDREAPGLGMESRMLTTAMLTAINDLRKAKRSIFFLATNRLRAFDSAITRPGRFDMQLFVGTPNLEARCIQLRQRLSASSIDEGTIEKAEAKYREYLQRVWPENAMFMNYLEGMQFASSCANIVLNNGVEMLTDDYMETILNTQSTVMTVRGQVREEYIASMGLSRF